MKTLYLTDASIIILSMGSELIYILIYYLEDIEIMFKEHLGKIWIMPVQWYFIQTSPVPGFKDFLENMNLNEALCHFFCTFWEAAFHVCEICGIEKKLE
ncbi:hypothetical protein L345_15468, partial [Ophiophagus hannah]